jgi:hypothetical protein
MIRAAYWVAVWQSISYDTGAYTLSILLYGAVNIAGLYFRLAEFSAESDQDGR